MISTVAIITILAIFTIASIVFQFKKQQQVLVKFDKLHVLPNYSFFAPKPLSNDFRLVYKVVGTTDVEWREVEMYKHFSMVRCFWNPFKYYNKGFIDTSNFLMAEFRAIEHKVFIKISENYINILQVISENLGESNTIRFAIVTSTGMKELEIKDVLFASYNQLV